MTGPSHRLGTSAALVAGALVVAAGCYAPAPPPGMASAGAGSSVGRAGAPAYGDYGPPSWYGGFGYASLGAVVHADFFGQIKGLDSGSGFTVTVPPLAPAVFVFYAIAVADVLEGGDGAGFDLLADAAGEEAFTSGFRDPTRRYISDFSIDLSFATSRHQDRDFGGSLDYWSILLGVRLAGPRRYVPRYYFSGGLGWYSFDYDNRPNAGVPGPYWGAGLELFHGPHLALGVDYKFHYYFGDDDAGVPVDGGARQLGVLMSFYW